MSQKIIDMSTKIAWPVRDDDGKPVTHRVANVGAYLQTRNVHVRHNSFTGLVEVSGLAHHEELSDSACNTLWLQARGLGLRDSFDTFCRALDVLADRNRFHPVLDYLEALTWDGVPRLDRWLAIYCGADDSPLNQAIGRATLLGAVRRVREPGCKFDTMLVLEGNQGAGKSTVAAILGGQWFADGLKLGYDAKHTIEATRGRWIIEVPELSGMTNREVEAVKHQLSCTADRARLAYARLATSGPRQWVAIGTTNADSYLRDDTGNRRFLPVKVGAIDLDALRRDRDQLWAEALFAVEIADAPAAVPSELWPAAAEAQEARRIASPIEERLADLLEGAAGSIVTKDDLWAVLDVGDVSRRTQKLANDLTAAMRKLGWKEGRQRLPDSGERVRVYAKPVPGLTAPVWLRYWDHQLKTETEISAETGNHTPCPGFETIRPEWVGLDPGQAKAQ